MEGLRSASFAERIDPATGVREIAEFVGEDRGLLRFLHLPPTSPTGMVMICSPVHAEFMKNYRREVRLARRLAGLGVAAVRLHYRGTGNSIGDPASVSINSFAADIVSTVVELTRVRGLPSPAYLGTRVGAVVASVAAPESASLALWEPVLRGDRWLKEGIRAATISSVSRQHMPDSDPRTPLERLESAGVLDLLGFALYRTLLDDVRRISLEDSITSRGGRMLLVQIGGGPGPRPANLQLVDRLRAKGADIQLLVKGREVAWWFEDGGARDFESDDDIIEPTATWLQLMASAR